jgi:hypothetical protein
MGQRRLRLTRASLAALLKRLPPSLVPSDMVIVHSLGKQLWETVDLHDDAVIVILAESANWSDPLPGTRPPKIDL